MHKLEIIGSVVAILFACVLVNDSETSKVDRGSNVLKGDLLALAATPFYAGYYLVN